MLLLILLYLFISLLCLCCGFIFYRFLLPGTHLEFKPLIFYAITGLVILSVVSQILVLFVAVNLFTAIIIATLISVLFLSRQKDFLPFFNHIKLSLTSLSLPGLILFFCLCLMISLLNAGPSLVDDTNSYHIQMIKWIREYGTVPGLANLHERYGFNSSWFSLAALFGFSSEQFNLYTVLNGVLSVWFCFYLISKSFTKTSSSYSVKWILILLFSLAIWPLIRGNATSANYDYISALIIFILFCETVIQKDTKSIANEVFIWLTFLFTVRIINFPFLLPALYILIVAIKQKEWKKVACYFIIAGLLFIPFLIRNIIISGYLFYPSTYMDIFSVDWKVGKETINQLLYYIKYYNRINIMTQPLEQTAALDFPNWIIPWFRQLTFYDKIIVSTASIGFITTAIKLMKKQNRIQTTLFSYFFFAAVCIQLLIWFFMAPDPRFIYGCFLCGVCGLFFTLSVFIKNETSKKVNRLLATVISLCAIFYTSQKLISTTDNRNVIIPKKLPIPAYREIKSEGIVYTIPAPLIPDGDTCCFGLKVPCLYFMDPQLRLRGKTIQSGFYLKKQ